LRRETSVDWRIYERSYIREEKEKGSEIAEMLWIIRVKEGMMSKDRTERNEGLLAKENICEN
jgi:hypothetical protein